MVDVIVVIDAGSSSVRCTAYPVVESATTSIFDQSPAGSFTEIHQAIEPITGKIDFSILRLIDNTIDQVLIQLRSSSGLVRVRALGFSTFVMNLIGLDENHQPIESLSYACNTEEVSDEVRAIRQTYSKEDLDKLYKNTGAPIHSSYAIPQLRALYKNAEADYCGRVKRWTTVSSFCIARWTSTTDIPISYSEASWTGLLNYITCEYEKEALDMLSTVCVEALPQLADIDYMPGKLVFCDEYLRRWPELKGCQLMLGIGDGAAANIGSKCIGSNRIACTIGTSAAARMCLPLPKNKQLFNVPPGLFCYRLNSNHVLVGGALTDGGSVIEWVSRLLGLDPTSQDEIFEDIYRDLIQDYTATPSGNNLIFLPLLGGERSTGFRTGATGSIIGLTRDTSKKDIVRASLEGVTLRLSLVIELLKTVCLSGDEVAVIVSGKALEINHVWRNAIADCSQSKLIFDSTTSEGTSKGVAVVLDSYQRAQEILPLPINEEIASTPRDGSSFYWQSLLKKHEEFLGCVSIMYSKHN